MQEEAALTVALRRVDPARNMQRFYRLDVQRDLFGAFCLVCEWGRIGRGGQVHTTPYPSAGAAQAALQKQAKRKRRRGYAP